MANYPQNILECVRTAKFARKCPNATAIGTAAKFDCGCVVRVSLSIDATGKIDDCGFSTNGCGYLVTAADSMLAQIIGKNVSELHGVAALENYTDRPKCALAAHEALRLAFADNRTQKLEEFRGETALICTCFGVTEDVVSSAISDNFAVSVEEVGDICRAGTGCGSCQPLIQEILDCRH